MKPSSLLVWCALLVAGCVDGIEGLESLDEDEPMPEAGENIVEIEANEAIGNCASVTSVVLYSESTNALKLPGAFAAQADPCTHYYVYLPAITDDKTQVRPTAANVHALGPNFHAMAEFHWAAWHNWIAQSPGTRNWLIAGKVFRTRMAEGGYDARDIWAINEFPSSTRTGEGDVWTHERNAVRGLAEGDGSRTVRGLVFLAGMGQNLQNFAVYKPNLKDWLQQTAYWADMASYVRFFSYEVYADPHYNCVVGSNVPADRANLNAYLEHLPQLAREGGDKTATAFAYLRKSYTPLLGSAWNATIGFGDNRISISDFMKFQRLQIYATHFWASQHGYPGRRIGFAWAPKNATPAQETDIANVIAGSVKRSYPAGGFYNLGRYACSADGGLDGCGCTVAGSYNKGWDALTTW
jgi:hypothetical protein